MILKMTTYRLKSAFLPQGWSRGVLVSVSEQGFITAVEVDATAHSPANIDVKHVEGIVVPGMPNAHSHAFQRAMAGKAEHRSSARDSFWTWRQAMYALANSVEPDELQCIATQLFIEMLKAGYTAVAEFHYLHRHPDGELAHALWEAIDQAADESGIALTFLPTLYQSSDFGGQPLKPDQSRFALGTEEFLRAIDERVRAQRQRSSGRGRTGAAFHSLRAVPLESLREAVAALRAIDSAMPLHIHVAEQVLEVRACEAATGRRPIDLLFDQGVVTPHWCLVHATHATAAELARIAAAQASVCVSISTEANLGDGFFDTARFLQAGGRLCVGSDSQSTVSPTEELRWLEYQQRLRKRRRAVLATSSDAHVGTRLWRDAAQHGARALGQPIGRIAVGCRADWLVLDTEHPTLAGAAEDAALDHLVFAGGDAAIRDVMVAGRWVIEDHHHPAEETSRRRFGDLMRRLGAR
jgi:formimidoylglutamate deiminase